MILSLCPALFVGVALGACVEPEPNEECGDTIIVRVNPSTDFSTIATFAVIEAVTDPNDVPGDLPGDIHESIAAANQVARDSLVARGLTEVDPALEIPDVWLFSVVSTDPEMGYILKCVPGYVWWGWLWGWDSCAWSEKVPITYEAGTVFIGLGQVEDDPDGELVFGGAIQGVLECEDVRERLELGVEKIFLQYPG
jgi:hypothetical protein